MITSPPSIRLDVTTDEKPTEITVHCDGRIASGTTELLSTTVRPLLSEGNKVALDMANVTYMDSSGLGTIVSLYASAENASCQLKLINLNQRLKEVLRHYGTLPGRHTAAR